MFVLCFGAFPFVVSSLLALPLVFYRATTRTSSCITVIFIVSSFVCVLASAPGMVEQSLFLTRAASDFGRTLSSLR